MDTATIAEGLLGLSAGLEIGRRYVVKPAYHWAKGKADRVAILFANVDAMALALGPNHGSSLADKLNRVERHTEQTNQLMQVTSGRVDRLMDHIERPIFETDGDGHLTRPNDAFCKMTGMPPEQLLGMGWIGIVAESDRERLMREIAWAKRDRRAYRVRVTLEPATGSRLEVLMVAQPKSDGQSGDVLAYFGAVEVLQLEAKAS